MILRVLRLAAILLPLAPAVLAEDAPKRNAATDLQDLQGTWRMDSFVDAKKTKVDPKTRTLFFGGETAAFLEGERLLQAGAASLVVGKTPGRLDVAVKKGDREGVTMLGIYKLDGDILKVCLDPEGDSRPTAFEAKSGTSHYVAVYSRVNKKAAGEIAIDGKYTCTSNAGTGQAVSATAEIRRLGDGYQVTYSVPGGVAYVGVGIRTADVLSVTWGNRGSVGLSVYRITKGPKLSGRYTMLGGPGVVAREDMKPLREKGKGKEVDVLQRD